MWSQVREHMFIRRGRTKNPAVTAAEHARQAGPEMAPDEGEAGATAASGAGWAAPEAAGAQVTPAGGEVQVPPANGQAEVLSAGEGARAPAAEERTPWQADDGTASSPNGDTVVLPVLSDIGEVTALPGAEQQPPNSSNGQAEVPSAGEGARAPAAEERTPWPADDG